MNQPGKSEFRIIPLGGLGEIGLNMMVFEEGDDIMIIDCGLMFPGDSLPGVDYVIPDFNYILENKDRVRGIVLTHGHEDHIGALPFLLKDISAPIYSTPLTLGLVWQKLLEYGLEDKVSLKEYHAGEKFNLGCFEIEFIRVSHSIADCVALAIKTGQGYVIHTGDFKLDPTPIDGKRVDLSAFARYGDLGVTVLLSDSTNVERSGFTDSEKEVGKALFEVFEECRERIIIATFASNIHRIQQVIDMAAEYGRKVAMLGRSMVANSRIAKELGHLEYDNDILIEPHEINLIPDDKLVLLTTGTQGEPLSGLSRMARNQHKQVKIKQGDTLILSSRFIPGNEKAIDYLINEFYRKGAEVIYEKVSDIHVSGHASKEELKLMMTLTKPDYFIPIHGEYRHLVQHAQLAAKMGIPKERILLAEDGEVVIFSEVGGERTGNIDAGRQVVDGAAVADSKDSVLRERARLGKDGILVATMIIDSETGEIYGSIELLSQGFLYNEEQDSILGEASTFVGQQIEKLVQEKGYEKKAVEDALQSGLKKYVKKSLMRFPVILPVIIET